MEILKRSEKKERTLIDEFTQQELSRRKFLRFSGMAGAFALLIGGATLTGCSNDDVDTGVNLGSGDFGVLNYAYALEQLEAAFYTQVMTSPYSGISVLETEYL